MRLRKAKHPQKFQPNAMVQPEALVDVLIQASKRVCYDIEKDVLEISTIKDLCRQSAKSGIFPADVDELNSQIQSLKLHCTRTLPFLIIAHCAGRCLVLLLAALTLGWYDDDITY